MINFIKKLFANYVEFEKQLTQICCLVVDNEQRIRKVIKKFPRKRKKRAMQEANRLALWGYSLDYIIKRLEIRRRRNYE